MDKKMEQKFGIYVFLGLLIGAVLGTSLGTGGIGIGGGALAGVFVGWFIAAAVIERERKIEMKKITGQ